MSEKRTEIEDLDDAKKGPDLSDAEAEKVSGGAFVPVYGGGGGETTTIDTIYSNGTSKPDQKSGD